MVAPCLDDGSTVRLAPPGPPETAESPAPRDKKKKRDEHEGSEAEASTPKRGKVSGKAKTCDGEVRTVRNGVGRGCGRRSGVEPLLTPCVRPAYSCPPCAYQTPSSVPDP